MRADDQPQGPRIPTALLFACFFGSGLTSLIYELLWVRRLNLVFGSTTYSITTVLAAFMAGLGLGSWLIGRRVGAGSRGVRTYAYLELGVAAFALCSLPLLTLVEWGFAAAQGALGLGQGAAAVLKFVMAFPVLALPAALMGGTLPALARAVVQRRAELHRRVGLLYGVNTVGAAVGTMLAGLVLIEHLGLWRSVVLAALINGAIGLAALWAARRGEAGEQPADAAEPEPPAVQLRSHLRNPAVAYCAVAVAVTGLLSMSYEVIWTRLLSLSVGSSTYSFTIILGIFLLGISAGALVYSRAARGRQPGAFNLAMVLTALAAWVTISMVVVPQLPHTWLRMASVLGGSLPRMLAGETLLAAGLLLVPTMLFGAALPMAMGVVARELGQVGRDVGGVYLCNTIGAIAGSVVTGFVLIPALGTQSSLMVGLLLNLVLAGVGLVLFTPRLSRRVAGVALVLLVGAAAALQPTWPPQVFDSGVGHRVANTVTGDRWQREQLLSWGGSRLVSLEEGRNATVAVRQFNAGMTLLVNGKPDASSHGDMSTQVLLGHIPMLTHRRPRAVAVVGWGSGVTAYSATFFPEVKRVDAIEIERAVLNASRHFRRVNGGAEGLPRVHLHLGDARSYLLATRRRYDVIISEPSNPWMAGVANLFSADFYRLARSRLRPGGIFGQWLQLYGVDSRSVALVFRTMLSEFEHVQLWFTDPGNLILLGSRSPMRVSLARVRRAFKADPRVGRYMAAFGTGMLPEQFFGAFLLGRAELQQVVDRFDHELMTDDRPVLEYWAVRSLYSKVQPHMAHLWRLKLARGLILPPLLGQGPPLSAAVDGAARTLRIHRGINDRLTAWATKRYPKQPFVWLARARHVADLGQHRQARKLLDKLPSTAGWQVRRSLILCRALVRAGRYKEALAEARAIVGFRPVARQLCRLDALVGARRYGEAWQEAEAALAQLDDNQDADVLGMQRRLLYQAIGQLTQLSKHYQRGIRAMSSRKEQDGGELDRLQALIKAQLAAKRPASEISRSLDQLARFGLISRRYLELCARVQREAGKHRRADRCAATLAELTRHPRGLPLWPAGNKKPAP